MSLYCPYCGLEFPWIGVYPATRVPVQRHIQKKHAKKEDD